MLLNQGIFKDCSLGPPTMMPVPMNQRLDGPQMAVLHPSMFLSSLIPMLLEHGVFTEGFGPISTSTAIVRYNVSQTQSIHT